jgi:Transglycosylase SLT domain
MPPRKQLAKSPVKKVVKRQIRGAPSVHPGPGSGPPGKSKKASQKQIFIWAEGQQESGGNYLAVNGSSGALGRWQVMPVNLPDWLAESGQKDMSPSAYLRDPAAQNRLAQVILGGDYDRWGARGAAAVWYSGQPDWHATYGDPPVYEYVNDVIAIMSKAGGKIPPDTGYQGTPGGTGTVVNVGLPPRPGKEDWSPHIIRSRNSLADTSRVIQSHSKRLATLKVRK